jgi:hypothetical protein
MLKRVRVIICNFCKKEIYGLCKTCDNKLIRFTATSTEYEEMVTIWYCEKCDTWNPKFERESNENIVCDDCVQKYWKY